MEKWPLFAETRGNRSGETRGYESMCREVQMQGIYMTVAIRVSKGSDHAAVRAVYVGCSVRDVGADEKWQVA